MLSDALAAAARADGIQRLVVGAVVHDDDRVLVVTRSSGDDFLPGIDELPSGGTEEGESLRQALDRELLEEVGFPAVSVDEGFLASFDYTTGSGRRARQLTVSVPRAGRDVRLSGEHSDARWIRRDEVDGTAVTPETRQVLVEWFGWRRNARG